MRSTGAGVCATPPAFLSAVVRFFPLSFWVCMFQRVVSTSCTELNSECVCVCVCHVFHAVVSRFDFQRFGRSLTFSQNSFLSPTKDRMTAFYFSKIIFVGWFCVCIVVKGWQVVSLALQRVPFSVVDKSNSLLSLSDLLPLASQAREEAALLLLDLRRLGELRSFRRSSFLRGSARAQEIGQVAGVGLFVRAETRARITTRNARASGLGFCARGGTRSRSGRDGLRTVGLRLCGFRARCRRVCGWLRLLSFRHAYAVCGCATDGAWSVVCGRLVVAEEVDEGLFLGTLVLARQSAEDVGFVFFIFRVGGDGVGVFVAVALAAYVAAVGVCGRVSRGLTSLGRES